MAATIKYGDTKWAVKDGNTLGYNDENRFKPVPFDFTRDSIGTRVDRNGLIETIGNNIPRIDFTDNTDGHLLLEPQSTNLITYSEDFSQGDWIKNNTSVSANNTTSPSGIINAYKLIEDTSNSQHSIYDNVSWTSGQEYTFSAFAKKDERNILAFVFPYTAFGAWKYVSFNLENGTTITVDSGVTANIEDYGNGWYRCSATSTPNATTTADMTMKIQLIGNTQGESYLGDGTSGIYIWGTQLEQLSYPTSYIPTNGSTVTRASETCTNAGNSTLINSTEGVLYAEIAALADDGTSRTISLSSGSTSNRVFIQFRSTSGQVNSGIVVSNSAQAVISHTITQTQYIKMAFKYKANDFALWVNGVEVGTDTSGTTFTANTLTELNFDSGSGAEDFYGKCKALTVFNTALTDAELTELTS